MSKMLTLSCAFITSLHWSYTDTKSDETLIYSVDMAGEGLCRLALVGANELDQGRERVQVFALLHEGVLCGRKRRGSRAQVRPTHLEHASGIGSSFGIDLERAVEELCVASGKNVTTREKRRGRTSRKTGLILCGSLSIGVPFVAIRYSARNGFLRVIRSLHASKQRKGCTRGGKEADPRPSQSP